MKSECTKCGTSFKPKEKFWKHRYRVQEENVQNVEHHSNQRRSSGNMVTEFMYKMWDFIQTKGEVLDAWRQSSWMIIYIFSVKSVT